MKAAAGIAGILLLLVCFFLLPTEKNAPPESGHPAGDTGGGSSSVFVKEGELRFMSGNREIKKIDVEIAENELERTKGLMYRTSLPESAGMLFIFDDAREHSFWMKNTSISLDIIYADRDKKIISIHKNTRPFSEGSIPSNGNAQYVVEVNAGFTDHYGIRAGDRIDFQ